MSSGRCNNRFAVALGIFDGVHIGHRQIVSNVCELAHQTDAVPIVVTFEPHPKKVLTGQAPLFLTNLEQKSALLKECGIEEIWPLQFTEELARMSAADFLKMLCSKELITAFCVGSNFRFGAGNAADAVFLKEWCNENGVECRVIAPVEYEGQPVSSSRIRKAVLDGELDAAEKMLGRRYSICGVVRKGYGIASKEFSVPTANLVEPDYALPPEGVYAARAILDEKFFAGIVYLGTAPTIKHDGQVVVELHLFDVEEDMYGRRLEVFFEKFIRPSRVFGSREELKEQIAHDIKTAKAFFKQK